MNYVEIIEGVIVGLGVSFFLTLISMGSIWFSRKIPGMASISIVQSGILIKMMMGGILSMVVFKFADINLWAYALTVGIYVCSVLPLLAYLVVKKDCTTQKRIKQMGNGNKRRII